LNRELAILPRSFEVTKLIVPPKLVERGVSAQNLVKSIASGDQSTLYSIFETFTPKIGFSEAFTEPLQKWVDVGNFGVLRMSAGTGVRHLGVDLEGELGEPVFNINDGTVRFAGALPNYGNTVIIDHGLGIFSGYLHLSEIKVNLNSKVKKGQIIGLVGSTGDYTLAPHLHFTVKILGASIDPKRFLDLVNQFIK